MDNKGHTRNMKNTATTARGELTNTCTCTVYDEETGEYTDEPSETCYGECWESEVEYFGYVVQELINNNETGWWRVDNLALWDGGHGGWFHANSVTELINGMTVRSAWTMRYEVFADRIEYSLSHHDAPMGSSTTLRPVTEDEREEMGLY